VGLEAWNWYMTSSRVRATKTGRTISDKPTPNTTQFSLGLYGEDDWTLTPDWIVNIGARLDRVDIVNDQIPTVEAGSRQDVSWGGHLGLTHVLTQEWSLTGLAASSYRTPNILELFKNISLGGGVTEIGDPDLDPERSLRAGGTMLAATGRRRVRSTPIPGLQIVSAPVFRIGLSRPSGQGRALRRRGQAHGIHAGGNSSATRPIPGGLTSARANPCASSPLTACRTSV
jgi:hypothetical protein